LDLRCGVQLLIYLLLFQVDSLLLALAQLTLAVWMKNEGTHDLLLLGRFELRVHKEMILR
jgi:hypothetical protein